MKLVVFDDSRVGVLVDGEQSVVDVTSVLPAYDPGLLASHWVRMCSEFDRLGPLLDSSARVGERIPVADVVLHAPILNPSKIIAAAANYSDHVDEMRSRDEVDWRLTFDVFLKAPSSVVAPDSRISLPDVDAEVHHEGELALVIGRGGKDIPAARALDHVLGWTILLDMTVRGAGDRSRRKSYDGFTPVGPWLVTSEEVPDWKALRIELRCNGELRQNALAGDMTVPVPDIIEQASRVMTLLPGDVITTGSPPGVGPVHSGDRVETTVTGLGRLCIDIE